MKYFFALLLSLLLFPLAVNAQASTSPSPGAEETSLEKYTIPGRLLATPFDFKRKRIRKVHEASIVLENAHTAPITIQKATWGLSSNIDFNVEGDLTVFSNLTLQPGETKTFTISFTPSSTGSKSATIQFTTTTGDVAESALSGTGILGRLATVDLDFGTTELKTEEYSKRRFMIQCLSSLYEDSVTILDLEVVSGTVSEDIKSPFSSDGFRYNKAEITFPITIHPGQTLIFLDSVEFQAQVHGSSIARLQTVSNAEAEVISVWTGKGASTSVENDHLTMSECSFTLGSNPITRDGGMIEFTIPTRSAAELSIYSLSGEKMLTLVNSIMDSGSHQVSIPVECLSAGVYGVRMVVGNCVKQKAMVLVQ